MLHIYYLILLIIIPFCSSFFFPPLGCSSCNCPSSCPPAPTCAIPLPCPTQTMSLPVPPAIQIPTTNYQPGWIPAVPAIPQPVPQPYSSPSFVQTIPPYSPQVVQPQYSLEPQYKSVGVGVDVQPQIYTTIPEGNYILEQKPRETIMPTLMPSLTDNQAYVDTSDKGRSLNDYDDTAPALPPPVPPLSTNTYRTTDTVQYMDGLNDNPPAFYNNNANAFDGDTDSSVFLHSGETTLEWPTLPMSRKTAPDGLTPFDALDKRHSLLKRMRNSKTAVPHTNSTCNSHSLANVMAKAIVEDVSVAKRMVMRATELAFDGARFDVFCATGEFSYSIHSRKYCEVTSGNVTCFAFR